MKRDMGWVMLGILLLSSILCIPKALAGNEGGNGGYGVVCKDSQKNILSVRVLDFYEAQVMRNILFSMGDPTLPATEKVKLVFKRLERLDYQRAVRYQQTADAFFDNALFLKGVILPATNDFLYAPVPANCEMGLIAYQKKPEFPEDRLYTISQDYWDKLDEDNKAGLMLHEIVLTDALARGQTDSVNTRYYVSVISSGRMDTMDVTKYDNLLSITGLGDAASGNLPQPLLWLQNPIDVGVQAGKSLNIDLTKYVHGGSDPIVFFEAENNNEGFLKFDPSGKITGTPTDVNIGDYKLGITATQSGGSASTTLIIHVTEAAQPQVNYETWVNQAFSVNLPASKDEVFNKVAGPAWVSLSSNGALFGTPMVSDTGTSVVEVQVSNSVTTSLLKVTIVVKAVGNVWTVPSLDLGVITEDMPWTFDLSNFMYSQSAKITGVNMPAWLTLSGTVLSGTPSRSDVGNFTFELSASTDTIPVFGSVAKRMHPVAWTSNPIQLTSALVGVAYEQNLSSSLVNFEGETVKYSLLSGPQWLDVTTTGELFGTPQNSNLGLQKAVIKAEDGDSSAVTTVIFEVTPVNHPPAWTLDTVQFVACDKTPFTGDLSSQVIDPDGDILTFAATSGASWVTVSSTGQVTGTPHGVGTSTLEVTATDAGGLSAAAQVVISVNNCN
jgi:hypothetical protein